MNGDGIDDVIVGAPSGDDGGNFAGEAYVIFGQAGAARGTVDLTGLAASEGFIIQGDAASDLAGHSVSSAGDVNGDGIDDVIVGAYLGEDGGIFAGEAYVIFGEAGALRGTVDLTGLTASDGFIIQGDAAFDLTGISVSSAGDVNGDEIDDVIVGARGGDDGGSYAGEAYVIYGQAGAARGTVDLTDLVASDGFIIQGDAAYDDMGTSVSSAGDVNGDGIDDVIVGANGGDDGGSRAGEAYVIFGQAGAARGTVDLTGLAASDGFIIQGDTTSDNAGVSVSSAGDVNGDGIDDVIVGANGGDDGGSGAGEAYVIFGRSTVDTGPPIENVGPLLKIGYLSILANADFSLNEDDETTLSNADLTIGFLNTGFLGADEEQLFVSDATITASPTSVEISGTFSGLTDNGAVSLFSGAVTLDPETGAGTIDAISENGTDSIVGGFVDVRYRAGDTFRISETNTTFESDLVVGVANTNLLRFDQVATSISDDGRFIIPDTLSIGAANPQTLNFVANQFNWGLKFADVSVTYDFVEDAVFLRGTAEANLSELFGGALQRFGVTGTVIADLADENYLKLAFENNELVWDVVGELSYSTSDEDAYLSALSVAVDTTDQSVSGGFDVNLPFTDVSLEADATFNYNPFLVDTASVALDGLRVPLGATGLILTGGSLGFDNLAQVFAEDETGSWFDATLQAGADLQLATPESSPPILSGFVDGAIGNGRVNAGIGFSITPSTLVSSDVLDELQDGSFARNLDRFLDISIESLADFEIVNVDADIDANFDDSVYSIDGDLSFADFLEVSSKLEISYPNDIFTLTGDMAASITWPESWWFIGGKTVDSNAKLVFSNNGDFSDDFVAVYSTRDTLFGEVGVGFRLGFDLSFEFLGIDEIELIGSWDLDPSNELTVLTAFWSNSVAGVELVLITPEGETITEAEFDNFDFVQVNEEFNSTTQRSLVLQSPYEGRWDIQTVQTEAILGEIEYQANDILTAPQIETLDVLIQEQSSLAEISIVLDTVPEGMLIDLFARNSDTGVRQLVEQITSTPDELSYDAIWDYSNTARGNYTFEAETNHPSHVTTSLSNESVVIEVENHAPEGSSPSLVIDEDTLGFGFIDASDIDGDTLSFSIETAPSNGVLNLTSDGRFTYTPVDNANGADLFAIEVADDFGGSDIIEVSATINAVNDAPDAFDDFGFETAFESDLVIEAATLLANDTDIESDAFSVISVRSGIGGEARLSGNQITFIPLTGFIGAASFEYTVQDENNGASTGSVSIEVTPVIELIGSAENDTLTGGANNDILRGEAGDDILSGGAGKDTLFGGAGNDHLRGGTGDDGAHGGPGDDTYILRDLGDTVIEAAGEGTDTVYARVDVTLSANVEKLFANAGSTGLDLIGNEISNDIRGLNGDDFLSGGAGNDSLRGKGGTNFLEGGADDDTLWATDGSNTLDGSTGNDIFQVRTVDTTVLEATGEGFDRVYTTVDFTLGADQEVEVLRAVTTAGVAMSGNELDNQIRSGAGADVLDGGTGNDQLIGGGGVDSFAFTTDWGTDVVRDFEDGVELLDLQGAGVADFGALTVSQAGLNTRVTHGDDVIILIGQDAADITAADFVF